MISTKELRDLFEGATKRAGDAFDDAKMPTFGNMPNLGRNDPTPGLLYFGLGILVGSLIGLVVAFLATPYNGEQARKKVSEQVEKVRQKRDEVGTNGSSTYPTPATAYERS